MTLPRPDILLSVPEEWCDVQNEMSVVCEMCWVRGEEVEGREQLVPNSLLYLVARTFSQGATVSKMFTNPVKNFPPCRENFTNFFLPAHKIFTGWTKIFSR